MAVAPLSVIYKIISKEWDRVPGALTRTLVRTGAEAGTLHTRLVFGSPILSVVNIKISNDRVDWNSHEVAAPGVDDVKPPRDRGATGPDYLTL